MKQNPSHRSVLLLHILVAVSLFSFCACKEEPVVEKKPPVVVNPEPDPEQYGTPYAGVPGPPSNATASMPQTTAASSWMR